MLAGRNGGDYRERRSQRKDAIDCKSPCQLIEKPVGKLDDNFLGSGSLVVIVPRVLSMTPEASASPTWPH